MTVPCDAVRCIARGVLRLSLSSQALPCHTATGLKTELLNGDGRDVTFADIGHS